jgi:ankyrin repeat protein
MNLFRHPGSVANMFTPGDQALATAVAANKPARIRALLAEGADAQASGERGLTLLSWAIFNHAPEALAPLIEAGADPARGDASGKTAVHDAAQAEQSVFLARLLDAGASPDTRNTITQEPPLSAAIMARRHEQFGMLLRAHATVDLADRMGAAPLLVAASINAMDFMLALLDAGANPLTTNNRGDNALAMLAITPENMLLPDVAAQRRVVSARLIETS